MLSIAPLRGAAARVDYLFFQGLSVQEREGVWMGSAAAYAGLRPGSRVDPTDLLLTLEGYAPVNRAQLQHHRLPYLKRLAGWDFTFSVSKSLSLAASVEGQPLAEDIPAAFDTAIEHVWPVIEHMLAPNSSQAQPDAAEPTPAIGARFRHWLSRYNDPHLHIHLIVPNTCKTEDRDGEPAWRAVDPIRAVLGSQDLDRLVQAEVARILAEKGHVVTLDEEGRAQLPVVPAELVARYSQGRAAILAAERAEREGRVAMGKPVARNQARGRNIINAKIHPEKTISGTRSTLRDDDAQRLRDALRGLRRRRPKNLRGVAPYERRKTTEKRDSLTEEANRVLADQEARGEVGRQIVARSVRSVVSKDRNTPLGAVLDAVLVWLRLWSKRSRERAALLGYADQDPESLHLRHAARRRAFGYAARARASRGRVTAAHAGASVR